jgi:REP element-mobilizing transposase RayT
LHITQRVQPGIGYLRTQSRLRLIQSALRDASDRFGMQVVHYSIQGNHLHLIVEADGAAALSRSMKSLAVRLAMGLNRLAGRRGAVFADRYHAKVLSTPRQVANALRYVLDNYRKHAREWLPPEWRDAFASSMAAPLRPPRVWLLRVGWQRAGQLAQCASSCSTGTRASWLQQISARSPARRCSNQSACEGRRALKAGS